MRSQAPEAMRARILRLSADRFAERGYHGTGLTELLEDVGIARGGFYHHFSSKEQVLLEIVIDTIDGILLSSAEIVRHHVDAAAKLRMLCDDLSRAIIENQAGFLVFLREYSALSHEAKERVLSRRRKYLARWEGVLEEGARTGLFALRETPYTEGILGMWIYSFVWNRGSISPQTIAADLADFVLRGVRAELAPLVIPPRVAGDDVDESQRRDGGGHLRAEPSNRKSPSPRLGATAHATARGAS